MTMASVPLQLQWPCTHPKRVQPLRWKSTWAFHSPRWLIPRSSLNQDFHCKSMNSCAPLRCYLLKKRHESWHFRNFNTQHVQCYPEDISTATVPAKSKSCRGISIKALPSSTNFWASDYAKMDCPPLLLFHISTPKWTKIIRHPKASNLNGCQASNVHDGLAILSIHQKKSWESVKFRSMLSNNAWIWDTNSMIVWFTLIHHTQHGKIQLYN